MYMKRVAEVVTSLTQTSEKDSPIKMSGHVIVEWKLSLRLKLT